MLNSLLIRLQVIKIVVGTVNVDIIYNIQHTVIEWLCWLSTLSRVAQSLSQFKLALTVAQWLPPAPSCGILSSGD